jgi:transposase-like protein
MVIYPLDFHRRAEQRWARRSRAAERLVFAEFAASRNAQCPNCCLLATKPFVSRFLAMGAIEHHWKCQSCDFDWSSVQPLSPAMAEPSP